MLHLTALALALEPPDRAGSVTVEGVAFGPRITLTCTWFTNFENSRFEQCRTNGANLLPASGGASVQCFGQTCLQLDARARRVGRGRRSEPPWGTFTVRIVGRISVHQHASRYLGDGTSTVLVESVLSVRQTR